MERPKQNRLCVIVSHSSEWASILAGKQASVHSFFSSPNTWYTPSETILGKQPYVREQAFLMLLWPKYLHVYSFPGC